MKFLNISSEIEQAMIQIFDAALKFAGISILYNIDLVRNAIQTKEENRKIVPISSPEIKEEP
jgi:hypothetical protein